MGVLNDVKNFFSRKYLPSTLVISLESNTVLTYKKVNEIVDSLNDYQQEIKRLPRSLAEFVRVSNNFCKHAIKVLKEYQKIMVSDVDSTNYDEYKENLKKALENIKTECNNKYILKWDEAACEKIFGAQNVKVGNNTQFIGAFAKNLGEAASETLGKLEERSTMVDSSLLLEIADLSKAKKIIAKLKLNITNPLAGKASRTIGSASQEIRKFIGEMFAEHNVDPVEYYKFDEEQYLGRSTVHAVLNILNSYRTDLKNYPKECGIYVNECLAIINKINDMIKSYLPALEVFMSAKRTRLDEIKARQNMKNVLKKLDDYLDNEANGENAKIFCLQENDNFKIKRIDLNYNVEHKMWPTMGNNSEEGTFSKIIRKVKKRGNTKNIDDQEIVLKGWSLGHFLLAFEPVVEKTAAELYTVLINLENNSIDYKKLEIKAPSFPKQMGSDRNQKNILEIIKKADLLKKQVYSLYTRVMSLSNSEDFKKDFSNVQTGVKAKYNELFGKDGRYNEFLIEYKEIDKWRRGIVKISADPVDPLQLCTDHFSKMNAYAEEIEKACNGWIKYYSKNAAAGERIKKETEDRVLKNVKLFKKEFSKIFAEAAGIFKEAKKEFDIVMKLKEKGSGDDLLATYKKTVTNKYAKIMDVKFEAPFKSGTLVVFDYNGFKEDNLYNCVDFARKFAEYEGKFDNFLTETEQGLKPKLEDLKKFARELKTEYDKAEKLFGRRFKMSSESITKEFDGIVRGLKNAISQYGEAAKLYEQDYNKLNEYALYSDSFGNSASVEVFKKIWNEVNSYYSQLGSNGLDVIHGKGIVYENAKLLLDDSEKLKKCKWACQIVSTGSIRIKELFEKVKKLANDLDKVRKNGSKITGYLANIRETYKAAKDLREEAFALKGDRFGKAFNNDESVKEFENLWQDLDSEYSVFCKEFGMPLDGKIREDVAKRIAVGDKQGLLVCEKQSKYFLGRLEWMQGYFSKVKELAKRLKNNEKIVKECAESVIKNCELVSSLYSNYASLNGLKFGDKFEKNKDVVAFKESYNVVNEKAKILIEKFNLINKGKPVEESVIAVSGDDEKVKECKLISEQIKQSLDLMNERLPKIQKFLESLKKQEDTDYALELLKREYERYQTKDIEKLVDDCKGLADKVGIGKLFSTELETYIKNNPDVNGQEEWEKAKKEYEKALKWYEDSLKRLENANKKLDTPNLGEDEKLELRKLEYTPSEAVEKALKKFKDWAETNKGLYEKNKGSSEKNGNR